MGNSAGKQERADSYDTECASPLKDEKGFEITDRKPVTTQRSLEDGTYSPRGECSGIGTTLNANCLPTVFKWDKGGKEVHISGTFSDWKPIQMVKSKKEFIAIIEVPEGDHQYKYQVDGSWVHNPQEPTINNDLGTKNNHISVKKSDFEVFEALAVDSVSRTGGGSSCTAAPGSPPGQYSQEAPARNTTDRVPNPPCLPPQLLQVILNQEVSMMCEPTLLPEPNHVMLNHLYALSIKDDIMVLSATHRYEKKYVTTLLYKPIWEDKEEGVLLGMRT